MRRTCVFIVAVVALAALATNVAAQSSRRPAAPPTIVIVEARPTSSLDGATLFEAYCASCHGRSGRGDGPAARAIRTPVPDLTQIANTHPDMDCFLHVLGDLRTGHRSDSQPKVSERDLDMPNWEPIFRSFASVDPAMGQIRLVNVSRYVASIQMK